MHMVMIQLRLFAAKSQCGWPRHSRPDVVKYVEIVQAGKS
jgi:hypothetical protein